MVHEVDEYMQKLGSSTSPSETISSTSWTMSPLGMVKVNTDAHAAAGLTVGLDFVVGNEWGEILLMGVRECLQNGVLRKQKQLLFFMVSQVGVCKIG